MLKCPSWIPSNRAWVCCGDTGGHWVEETIATDAAKYKPDACATIIPRVEVAV